MRWLLWGESGRVASLCQLTASKRGGGSYPKAWEPASLIMLICTSCLSVCIGDQIPACLRGPGGSQVICPHSPSGPTVAPHTLWSRWVTALWCGHTLWSRPRPSVAVEVADSVWILCWPCGQVSKCRVGGVGKQQVRSMGHFKQLLISEPCGEPRHGKGDRKQKSLYQKISSGDTQVCFYWSCCTIIMPSG